MNIDWSKKVTAEDRQREAQKAAQRAFETAIQAHMDAQARSYGYDHLTNAVTYAEEEAVPKFQHEGKAFRAWRSEVWAYAYEQLNAVLSGARAQPSVDELLAELPPLQLKGAPASE